MEYNKLYSKQKITKNKNVSKIRYNREYLISNSVENEFNTYLSFAPFRTFNDLFNDKFKKDPGTGEYVRDLENQQGSGTPGVRSLFNKSGSVVLGSSNGSLDVDVRTQPSAWRISNNVPLMDAPETRRKIRKNTGCSVKELVTASQAGLLGRSTYDYSDFMYCKHLGKISNNYLITLRRFPLPVDDFISSVGEGQERNQSDSQTRHANSIGCMVTWLGTPGNEMNNILKYSFNMPFKEQQAQWEDPQGGSADADSQGGILNGIAAAFDSSYRKQYMASGAGSTLNKVINPFLPKYLQLGDQQYPAAQFENFRDKNKVYGPVDAVKAVYIRSDEGLKFSQSFTLVFDYELRSYNGINGRQAMLDLLSNILNVTYSTGTFWGGGYKGGGAHQNNVFANLNIFKAQGGFTDYVDAFAKDFSSFGQKAKNLLSSGNFVDTLKNALNQLGGMIIAGQLNKLGRPLKAMYNSLLSPAPIGFWHVTIGNPHAPIMSMGNMIIKNTTIEHYGPLGLDDFPTGLKVTVELERGKPRDIREIEKLYMHGNDRIYSSMGPKVFDMYKHAKEYKGNTSSGIGHNDKEIDTSDIHNISVPNELSEVLQKYFGQKDPYSIYVAACEQEYGAHKKPKKESEKSAPKQTTKPKRAPTEQIAYKEGDIWLHYKG